MQTLSASQVLRWVEFKAQGYLGESDYASRFDPSNPIQHTQSTYSDSAMKMQNLHLHSKIKIFPQISVYEESTNVQTICYLVLTIQEPLQCTIKLLSLVVSNYWSTVFISGIFFLVNVSIVIDCSTWNWIQLPECFLCRQFHFVNPKW